MPDDSYAHIEPSIPLGLFGGRLPLGEVVMVVGPEMSGKSTMTRALESAVSNGDPFPGEGERYEEKVVTVSLEDDDSTSTVWTYIAHDAVRDNIINCSYNEEGDQFQFPRDLGLLRAKVEKHKPQLVTLDSWYRICPARRGQQVSANIMELQKMARETGCCVFIIHHTRADGVTVSGSQELTASVRCILRLACDPKAPDERILSVERTNLKGFGRIPDIRFAFEGEGLDTRIRWITQADIAARNASWRPAAAAKPWSKPHDWGQYETKLRLIQGGA